MIKLYKSAGVRDGQTWIFTPNQNGLYQRGERERERERAYIARTKHGVKHALDPILNHRLQKQCSQIIRSVSFLLGTAQGRLLTVSRQTT